MKIKGDYESTQVSGKYFVVPLENSGSKFKGMIELNETAKVLWNFYQEEHTIKEGAEYLCSEYFITPETAMKETEKFLSVMKECYCVE